MVSRRAADDASRALRTPEELTVGIMCELGASFDRIVIGGYGFSSQCAMNFRAPICRPVFFHVSIHAFRVLSTMVLVWAGVSNQARGAILYNVHDLGAINGDRNSFAVAINSSGQIAGFATVSPEIPVFWTNYSSPAVALSQAGATFRANGLNNAGQIVGGTTDNQGRATFWTNSASPAFYLDASGEPRTEADAINAGGEIVGRFTTLASVSGGGLQYPCVWKNNSTALQPLDYLGGTNGSGSAHAINDSGEIVGSTGAFKVSTHATYWTNSTSRAVDLGTLGGTNSFGSCINATGQIVGGAYNSNQLMRAAFWTNSVSPPIELPPLGTSTNYAAWINDLGQVVGAAGTAPTAANPFGIVAVLWTNLNSGPVDLNTVISPNYGWALGVAYAINDSGEIVGFGAITNGGSPEAHAFALTPINQRAPMLQFSVNSNQLTLGWPTNLSWVLEVQTNGLSVGLTTSNNWYDVPGSSTRTNMVISIIPTNPAVFYRLRSPNSTQ